MPAALLAQPAFSREVTLAALDQDGDPEIVTSLWGSTRLMPGNRDVDLAVALAQMRQAWLETLRSQPGYAAFGTAAFSFAIPASPGLEGVVLEV